MRSLKFVVPLLLVTTRISAQSLQWPAVPLPAPITTTVPGRAMSQPPVATATATATAPTPKYTIFTGASFNRSGSPKFGGQVSVCYWLSATTCSYTTEQITTVSLKSPIGSTSLRTGVATKMGCMFTICFLTAADMGASSTVTGGVAAAFSGVGLAIEEHPLLGFNWGIEGRIIKSGPTSSFMFTILLGK